MIEPNTAVRFTNGKFKGFQGTVKKSCDNYGSVEIIFENNPCEVVEAWAHMTPLDQWISTLSPTERNLKGLPT